MVKGLINYATFCLIWLIVIVTIQIVRRKNFMKNYAFMVDANSQEEEEIMNTYPPIDGWLATVIMSFIPLFNVFYAWFLGVMAFSNEENDLLISFRMAAREVQRKIDERKREEEERGD